jgi:hypothetical protein
MPDAIESHPNPKDQPRGILATSRMR